MAEYVLVDWPIRSGEVCVFVGKASGHGPYGYDDVEAALLVVPGSVTVAEICSILSDAGTCAQTACDLLHCVGVHCGEGLAQVFDGGLKHLGEHETVGQAVEAAKRIMDERAKGVKG